MRNWSFAPCTLNNLPLLHLFAAAPAPAEAAEAASSKQQAAAPPAAKSTHQCIERQHLLPKLRFKF